MTKRLALVTAVYPPEPVVSARITRDLAEHLAGQGHEVTVVAPFPTRPYGSAYPGYELKPEPMSAMEDGIHVMRVPSFTCPESRFVGRMKESRSFGEWSARCILAQSPRPDAIYANTWPLMAQGALAGVARSTGIPLVLHIQDVYPEIMASRLPGVARLLLMGPLRAYDGRVARSARSVVVIAEGTRARYVATRRLQEQRVAVVENWQDEQPFFSSQPRPRPPELEPVSDGAFTFLYLGNIAPTSGLEFMIRAFHKAALTDARLVLIGDGSSKNACIGLAGELGLRNVAFLSCRNPADVPLFQSVASVCLLPIMPGAALNGVPSKLAAYLFSARPVLASVDALSDSARAVRDAGCGWIEAPGDVDGLAARMKLIRAMPAAELERMGQAGRAYGLAHYSKAAGVRKLAGVVLRAAGAA